MNPDDVRGEPVERMCMRKFVAIAAAALVGVAAFAGSADAATWRTVAQASDSSPYGPWASLTKTTGYGTKSLRVKTRGPRGFVNVEAYVSCNSRDWMRYGSRTVSWRYWSSGYSAEVNTHKLPVPVYNGSCTVMLDAESGKAGRVWTALQRYG
jgi:hypothetical protein